MSEKRFLGPGCKACPVREFGYCDTITYRGSRCAELRDKIGLDDPETVTPVNYTYRGIHCIGVIYGVSPMRFLLDKDGKYVDFQYENHDDFYPVDELEFVEKAIDAFLELSAIFFSRRNLEPRSLQNAAISRKIQQGSGYILSMALSGKLCRRTLEKSIFGMPCYEGFPKVPLLA